MLEYFLFDIDKIYRASCRQSRSRGCLSDIVNTFVSSLVQSTPPVLVAFINFGPMSHQLLGAVQMTVVHGST